MSGGYRVDPATLEQVAGTLAEASDELSAPVETPGEIQAGRLSGVLSALSAHLSSEANKLLAKVDGATEAVRDGGQAFVNAEEDAAGSLPAQVPPMQGPR